MFVVKIIEFFNNYSQTLVLLHMENLMKEI
jgi:hypothetical protein